MDEPRDCHTEGSQSDWEDEIWCDITYIWNLKKKDPNELIDKTETDLQTWDS